MNRAQFKLSISTNGQGLYLITDKVREALGEQTNAGVALLNIFIQHTSASLLIQENSSPSARRDLENFIDRLVPENQSWHEHLDEGPDDTVSHLKAALTVTSLTIPMINGQLQLGTWQGIYLWEHRRAPHTRNLLLTQI